MPCLSPDVSTIPASARTRDQPTVPPVVCSITPSNPQSTLGQCLDRTVALSHGLLPGLAMDVYGLVVNTCACLFLAVAIHIPATHLVPLHKS